MDDEHSVNKTSGEITITRIRFLIYESHSDTIARVNIVWIVVTWPGSWNLKSRSWDMVLGQSTWDLGPGTLTLPENVWIMNGANSNWPAPCIDVCYLFHKNCHTSHRLDILSITKHGTAMLSNNQRWFLYKYIDIYIYTHIYIYVYVYIYIYICMRIARIMHVICCEAMSPLLDDAS